MAYEGHRGRRGDGGESPESLGYVGAREEMTRRGGGAWWRVRR